ncbi:MAG: hypothetical protein GTO67_12610 [Gammaproteobacteria bacterium]|nr:hypothetical protein [Gammaproteobacteria bacterium]NIM73845.1 hypothetical protein [Gammaproteobacteria bacterium]NIN39422.1 hypothetical protein [Gammaproteobacteria bacterium]NIO25087.1 hypothetical protein [Gammaproteobacteria bacterium]NIO65719.1 hypothetical protein [Gammaproteobacteria bacterium]
MIRLEVRLFNSLARYAENGNPLPLTLPEGSTIGDALRHLAVPEGEIFLLTLNGHNVMRGFGPGSGIETERALREGDVLSFSGPVPFSRGYGSPVI